MESQRTNQQHLHSGDLRARTTARSRKFVSYGRRITIARNVAVLVMLSSTVVQNVESWSVNRLATIRPTRLSFSPSPSEVGSKRAKVKSILRRILPFQSTSSDDVNAAESRVLKAENQLLREVIGELEEENARLKQRAGRIVLETFEGENYIRDGFRDGGADDDEGLTLTGEELMQDELWCDELEDGKNVVCYIMFANH